MAKRIQRTVSRPDRSRTSDGARPRAERRPRRLRRVSEQAINDFTVRLATLSAAGIPIVKALGILEGQAPVGPFKRVLANVVEDVSAGTPLSEALEKEDRVFDRLYSSMVRAGEAGGVLDTVLTRLAHYRERAAEVRAKVVGALVYPVFVMAVAVIVVAAVIVIVIPRFEQIFDSFDVELPGATRLLLALSSFFVERWYVVFGLPVVLLLLHGILMRRGGRYRTFWHGAMLKVPLLGIVLSRSLVASFARTFGTLLQAGVPHLDALGIVRDTSSNDVLINDVEHIRVVVREGEGIAQPMSEAKVFDELVVNMVEVGEETGELDTMLLRVADAYEREVDRKAEVLFKWLEPALLIMVAILVGFIVIALFLPLLSIMSSLNQQ